MNGLCVEIPGDHNDISNEIDGRLAWRSLMNEISELSGSVQTLRHTLTKIFYEDFQYRTNKDFMDYMLSMDKFIECMQQHRDYGAKYNELYVRYQVWKARFAQKSPKHREELKVHLLQTFACYSLCKYEIESINRM